MVADDKGQFTVESTANTAARNDNQGIPTSSERYHKPPQRQFAELQTASQIAGESDSLFVPGMSQIELSWFENDDNIILD